MDTTLVKSSVKKGFVNKDDICGFITENTVGKLNGNIYALIYKHHKVQIGIIQGSNIEIERKEELTPEFLKELRVFSQNGELYVWKQGREFKYRLRIDGENKGKEEKVYEQEYFMWGNGLKKDGCTIYERNRGMELKFPFHVEKKQLPLKYRVRNYYDYDKNGLIRFKDARLVCFLDNNGEEL